MKYTITHACGHTQDRQIYGTDTRGQRGAKALWLESQPCSDCSRAQRDRDRAEESARAAAHAAAEDWPELSGTPRQVAWAQTVRADAAAAYNQRADRVGPPTTQELRQFWRRTVVSRYTDASWWIEHRDMTTPQLLRAALTDADRTELEDLVATARSSAQPRTGGNR